MALYFAVVKVDPGVNLYTAIVTHYTGITKVNVPVLVPPIPRMVYWLRVDCETTGTHILGSYATSPYYISAEALPMEFTSGGGRNTIDLSSLYFDNAAQALFNIAFQII